MQQLMVLLLPRFCAYFHFKLCSYCSWGRSTIFAPRAQGNFATPLTKLRVLLLRRNGFTPAPAD